MRPPFFELSNKYSDNILIIILTVINIAIHIEGNKPFTSLMVKSLLRMGSIFKFSVIFFLNGQTGKKENTGDYLETSRTSRNLGVRRF